MCSLALAAVSESRPASRGALACGAVLTAFLALGFAAVLRHEPWRDEIEIWLIARDSAGLGELLHNMRTQGHPVLWYLVNFGLSRFTRDPLAMQLANLAFGAAAALVFFRAAPFGLAVRLLFAFGYFALFEFTVIARSYALGLLLLFGFCARAARREPRIDLPGAALLALLANTHLFGTIAAVAFVAIEAATLRRRLRSALPALALASLGAAVGFGHVLAQSLAIGPAHVDVYPQFYNVDWLLAGLATLAFGALPVPDPATAHPWNSNLMHSFPGPWGLLLSALLGVGLVCAGAWALRQRPRWLVAFLLGLAPMLVLTLFVYTGLVRHNGQPFIWFLACAWLAGGLSRESGAPRLAEPILAGVLAVQALAGAVLLAADHARPFSSARAAAAWLEREHPDALLVGCTDYAVEPIAGWTHRPFYYPDQQRTGTFMDWGKSRRLVPMSRVLEEAAALARGSSRRVLLVLDVLPKRRLALGGRIAIAPDVHAQYVARFVDAIVPDENYHVLLLYDPRRSATPGGR